MISTATVLAYLSLCRDCVTGACIGKASVLRYERTEAGPPDHSLVIDHATRSMRDGFDAMPAVMGSHDSALAGLFT